MFVDLGVGLISVDIVVECDLYKVKVKYVFVMNVCCVRYRLKGG